ncbi:retrovirus-related Pol polyprotein from type-1 retrotransposable element R2 [Trichonephila clavipes]|nr:retrovirus-related Pol polyprotein from type-1 retrotransposable element R2 [Trichonephila clavipes]
MLCGTTVMSIWAILRRVRRAKDCFADTTSRNKSPERSLRIVLTGPMLLVIAFSIRKVDRTICCSTEGDFLLGFMSVVLCSSQYASTHHGAQQGEAARRSSDMRQARHLPQRWYWKPVVESAELITSRLTGAGSLLPPVYGEAWAKGHATGTPDSTFPRVWPGHSPYGEKHTKCSLQRKDFKTYDGVIEHNFLITQHLKEARRDNQDRFLAWLDISNAFGSVPHEVIINALVANGVDHDFVSLMSNTYMNSILRVFAGDGLTDPIVIKRGVKQGCPLKGILFNLAINQVLRTVQD